MKTDNRTVIFSKRFILINYLVEISEKQIRMDLYLDIVIDSVDGNDQFPLRTASPDAFLLLVK